MSSGLNRECHQSSMSVMLVYNSLRNYPCCTVNHPAAYPKFWMHSFFTGQNGTSLVHALLGPSTYTGTLAGSNNVTGMFLRALQNGSLLKFFLDQVAVDTLYPFSTTLDYTISALKSFDFHIRVPDWALSNSSTISIAGSESISLEPDSMNLHTITVHETCLE